MAKKEGFRVLVCEEETGDVFGPEVAEQMRLPFDKGWSAWGVFQGDYKVAQFSSYDLAVTTASALNSTLVLEHAA